MKDDRGLYYYPVPSNSSVKMYVRKVGDDICFRLWKPDDPQMWEEHGWTPYEAIKQAAAMYEAKTSNFDPLNAYDIKIAEALVKGDR